jgi:hypothetical protein
MRLLRISSIVMPALLWASPMLPAASVAASSGQATEACLHSRWETPAEARRRDEALDAMRIINNNISGGQARRPNQPAVYLTWPQLAESPGIALWRGMAGPIGDLVRKIQWGSDEPLPGWRIHYLTGENAYSFSLTDVRDRCRLTYYSNESGVIVEGQPVGDRGFSIVPIT